MRGPTAGNAACTDLVHGGDSTPSAWPRHPRPRRILGRSSSRRRHARIRARCPRPRPGQPRHTRVVSACPSNRSSGCPRLTRRGSCVRAPGAGSRDRSSPPPPRRTDALRSPARATLAVLPFQLEPVLAVVRGLASRVLIADEVGLGKTVQAGLIISELLERRPDSHVLVVTPAGLRHQWQTELRERFALDATSLDSASIARHAAQWNGNPWSIPGVVLTSLDYVKRPEVVRALEALVWDVVVFDEAHALAGRSDRATAAAMLARRARTLVLLTATPHSGDDQAFSRLDVARRLLQPVSLARVPPHPARRRHASPPRRTVSLACAADATRIRDAPRTDDLCAAGLETVICHRARRAPGDDRADSTRVQQCVVAGAIGGDASAPAERRRTRPISSRCHFRSTTPPRRRRVTVGGVELAWTSGSATKNGAGSSTSFGWRGRPQAHESKIRALRSSASARARTGDCVHRVSRHAASTRSPSARLRARAAARRNDGRRAAGDAAGDSSAATHVCCSRPTPPAKVSTFTTDAGW